MKKKALATKMAAFVMAGAMTMAMGFPALAVESDTTPAETDHLSAPLTKTLSVGEYTFAPNTTFDFTITPKSNSSWGADSIDQSGPIGGLYFSKDNTKVGANAGLPFAPSGETPASTYTNTMRVNIDTGSFSKPGRYHYVVRETQGSYEGVDYTGADEVNAKEIIVYVVENRNGGLEYFMSGKVLEDSDLTDNKTGKLETIAFENKYGSNDPDSKVKKLEIKKTISGDFAFSTDVFTISVKIDQQTTTDENKKENYYVAVNCGHDSSKTKTDKLESGTEKTFQVHGNDTITVYGLSANDTFTVKETDDKGYTATYDFNQKTGSTWTANAEGYYTGNIKTGENSGDAKVTINNEKKAATPTGIVTEYAPYILLVAAAGAFAVLFLRRKKEEF